MSNPLGAQDLRWYARLYPFSQGRSSLAMLCIMVYLAAEVVAAVLLQVQLPQGP